MSGYSGTPLAKKLGIKEGYKVMFKNPPDNYKELLKPLPDNLHIVSRLTNEIDLIQFFTKRRDELEKGLKLQITKIKQNGMIWVSWPKKSSKVKTDITEDVIREIALPMGLVDVKVCAVDETWSGLKLVIRKENRK
jgi:bifunctional DNA-binding transcriptional regulator/antitoxin component of YhaV-PrlF toxin-antitoxin module